MQRKNNKILFTGISFIIGFIVWTILIRLIDVKQIGPQDSSVGFATFNLFFHNLTKANILLYEITDWLSIIPLAIVLCFASLGLIELITRKSLFKIDKNIILLGVFYLIVLFFYVLFEIVTINYRPILIDGFLETSYPSSTTMLVISVMGTTFININHYIKNNVIKRTLKIATIIFINFMVICRIISGVHWITDIIGGTLFSVGIVLVYYYFDTLLK